MRSMANKRDKRYPVVPSLTSPFCMRRHFAVLRCYASGHITQSVEDWLNTLQLGHLSNRFAAAGYNDCLLIQEMGLTEADMLHFNLAGTAEATTLMTAAAAPGFVAENLSASVDAYLTFGRGEAVFRVESRLGFVRSTCHWDATNFDDLHGGVSNGTIHIAAMSTVAAYATATYCRCCRCVR